MTGRKLIKFAGLKLRNVVTNHPHLKDLIDKEGFPPGFWTGPNTHVWFEDEVDAWLDSRPTERPPRRNSATPAVQGREGISQSSQRRRARVVASGKAQT
jgi:hypothetical protein